MRNQLRAESDEGVYQKNQERRLAKDCSRVRIDGSEKEERGFNSLIGGFRIWKMFIDWQVKEQWH